MVGGGAMDTSLPHSRMIGMSQAEMGKDPRYPIGKFQYEPATNASARQRRIELIATVPERMRESVSGLSEHELETPYREDGWTIRQVVHHVPDSHMNSYVRYKLALTEEQPAIKPYDEAAWAKLPDSRGAIEPSLKLLESLHERWTGLLRSMSDEQWERKVVHPERGLISLEWLLALYAWHGEHHLGHVRQARERIGK